MKFISLGLDLPAGTKPEKPTEPNGWHIRGSSLFIWTIWKTVVLGKHPTALAYEAALKEAQVSFGKDERYLLENMIIAKAETAVDLVDTSVGFLGFTKSASRNEIYARAEELGLRRCPAEVGPALRLVYTEQPSEERLNIAMDPLARDGYREVFTIGHTGKNNPSRKEYELEPVDELWLGTDTAKDTSFWYPNSHWVFVHPRTV